MRKAQGIEHPRIVIGHQRLEVHALLSGGMIEPEAPSVQELVVHASHGIGERPRRTTSTTVERVAEERTLQVAQVDSDLVGTPGLETTLHEADHTPARVARAAKGPLTEHAPVGDGPLSARLNREADPVLRMPAEGGVHSAFGLWHTAPDQCRVAAGHCASRQLGGQVGVGLLGSGNHEHAAGASVEAVHDAGAVGIARTLTTKPMQDGIDQRTVGMTASGMHHHAGRFVHHEEGIVLMQNPQGQVLGHHFRRRGGRQAYAHGLATQELVTRPSRAPIDFDLPSTDECGETAPRDGQAARQPGVEAPRIRRRLQQVLFSHACGAPDP